MGSSRMCESWHNHQCHPANRPPGTKIWYIDWLHWALIGLSHSRLFVQVILGLLEQVAHCFLAVEGHKGSNVNQWPFWSPGSYWKRIKGGFTMDSSKSFHQKENDLRPSLALQNYWNDKWFYLTHAVANNKSKLSTCKSQTFLHDILWMSFSVVLSQIWSCVLVSISAITPCIVLSALSSCTTRGFV